MDSLTVSSIAQERDGFQRHATSPLDSPLVVLLQQDRAHAADDGLLVGEDAHNIGASFEFPVQAFDRIGGNSGMATQFRREALSQVSP